MKNIFFIIIIVFASCSRKFEDNNLGSISKNYVIKYVKLQQHAPFSVYQFRQDTVSIHFKVDFHSELLINNITVNDSINQKFATLSKNNGDTAFNMPISACFPYPCIGYHNIKFNVTSNIDYHSIPAGMSLNELFKVIFLSAKEYIQDGYPPYEGFSPEIKRHLLMPLDEFNIDRSLVSSFGMELHLYAKPEGDEQCILYFEYSDSNILLKDSLILQK